MVRGRVRVEIRVGFRVGLMLFIWFGLGSGWS
jgi:hypothetical protein